MICPIITVENLSKSYLVGHQFAPRERYTALRDVIGRKAKSFARNALDMLRGHQMVQGDEIEEFWALRDVSFEVSEGEVVGIIGRNGAGKSTLLKILSRIAEPTKGRVTLRGRVASLLEVGTGFHPELTGRENIFLNGAILGMARVEIKRKFDEIVDFAGVETFLDTPVKRYSSGMYVRLAFAVAAHMEPEILIVDEVLAVGDMDFQRKCMGKLQNVARTGRTVLFVSHNMGAVSALCTRGVLLSGGRVKLVGEVSKVVEYYSKTTAEEYEVAFSPDQKKPSITRITIDRDALQRRHLRMEVAFCSPTPLQTPIGGVILRGTSGEPVWGSSGRFHPRSQGTNGISNGVIMCDSPDIPLQPGSYLVSIWLADWYTDHDAKLDRMRITIGDGQGDTLRPPASVIGYLDWPANWTCSAC